MLERLRLEESNPERKWSAETGRKEFAPPTVSVIGMKEMFKN